MNLKGLNKYHFLYQTFSLIVCNLVHKEKPIL